MFLGKFSCTLNTKNHLLTPISFREQLSGALFVTQGFDQNLLILTNEAFQEIYQRVASLNIADPLARLLLRLILGTAHELHLDSKGFLALPAELSQFAKLKNEVLAVGQGDYLEIWAPEMWNEQETILRDTLTNSSRFSALRIATRPS